MLVHQAALLIILTNRSTIGERFIEQQMKIAIKIKSTDLEFYKRKAIKTR